MVRKTLIALPLIIVGALLLGCSGGESEPQGHTMTAAEMQAKGGDAGVAGGGPAPTVGRPQR